MKKTLIITTVSVLVLIIIGVWAYFFFFAEEERNGDASFSNLNTDPNAVIPQQNAEGDADTKPLVGDATSALRQLTTRPVAGAEFTTDGIRFVEKGTGHVYDVTLPNGNESLVTNTTIPRVVRATFSPNANRVLLTSEENNTHNVSVGTITKNDDGVGALDGVDLPLGAREVAFSDSGDSVYYLLDGSQGALGYAYNIAADSSTQRFSIPLRDIRVFWGDETYVYTTPTAFQTGYVYRVDGSTLSYVREGAPGLTAIPYQEGLLVSHDTEGGMRTTAYEEDETYDIPVALFTDKCVDNPAATSTLYCGSPLGLGEQTVYPDDWYKGITRLTDLLFEVRVAGGSLTTLSNMALESGHSVDIAKIGTNANGSLIYFINKNDDTLWLFDTTVE